MGALPSPSIFIEKPFFEKLKTWKDLKGKPSPRCRMAGSGRWIRGWSGTGRDMTSTSSARPETDSEAGTRSGAERREGHDGRSDGLEETTQWCDQIGWSTSWRLLEDLRKEFLSKNCETETIETFIQLIQFKKTHQAAFKIMIPGCYRTWRFECKTLYSLVLIAIIKCAVKC